MNEKHLFRPGLKVFMAAFFMGSIPVMQCAGGNCFSCFACVGIGGLAVFMGLRGKTGGVAEREASDQSSVKSKNRIG